MKTGKAYKLGRFDEQIGFLSMWLNFRGHQQSKSHKPKAFICSWNLRGLDMNWWSGELVTFWSVWLDLQGYTAKGHVCCIWVMQDFFVNFKFGFAYSSKYVPLLHFWVTEVEKVISVLDCDPHGRSLHILNPSCCISGCYPKTNHIQIM